MYVHEMQKTHTTTHANKCTHNTCGRGAALVESMPFDQRVAGLNPTHNVYMLFHKFHNVIMHLRCVITNHLPIIMVLRKRF